MIFPRGKLFNGSVIITLEKNIVTKETNNNNNNNKNTLKTHIYIIIYCIHYMTITIIYIPLYITVAAFFGTSNGAI